ncbi:unnamed protein product [Lepeophtheirus salmonis]|uniref:(salmon louse) hypothetical protein n=1 Tax=Lepeophtheirus salmonis TaxID=72036 RepID=A0A817FBX1_LEPSM|nr:unnamed protein product [Lepeophtheirus salmonis]
MDPIQKIPFGIEMGKTRSLSYWDILKIRKAYNCSMCLTLGLKKPCKFPFKYYGKMYYTCTDAASDTLWCATEVREDTKEYTEYDYCEPSCIQCGTSNHPSKSCNQTTEGEKGTAQLEDYPWHVFIMKWKEDVVKCEGAILTKHHAISAASCIKEYDNEILVIKTGSVDSQAFSTPYILYYINNKAYHPDYDSTTHENDIVILTAEFNIVPNVNLIPVCLPQVSNHDFNDMPATYTGVDIPAISTHTKLGFLITKIVNDNKCKSSHSLCAQAINTSSNGNWGSPLVAKVDGSCALIGIHSKQTEGDKILKFTRIDRYLDWIKPKILHYYIYLVNTALFIIIKTFTLNLPYKCCVPMYSSGYDGKPAIASPARKLQEHNCTSVSEDEKYSRNDESEYIPKADNSSLDSDVEILQNEPTDEVNELEKLLTIAGSRRCSIHLKQNQERGGSARAGNE